MFARLLRRRAPFVFALTLLPFMLTLAYPAISLAEPLGYVTYTEGGGRSGTLADGMVFDKASLSGLYFRPGHSSLSPSPYNWFQSEIVRFDGVGPNVSPNGTALWPLVVDLTTVSTGAHTVYGGWSWTTSPYIIPTRSWNESSYYTIQIIDSRTNGSNSGGDAAAPTVQVSSPAYSTNQSPTSKFNVRWSADSADSYGVQYKVGLGGAWKAWKSGTTATSAYFTGDPGKTYYFRARAKKGGKTGSWSAAKSTVVPYNQSVMTYKGSWGSASAAKMYKTSARFSARKNASATYAFKNASKLSLIITKRPRGGKADVFIDGAKIKTIDLYASVARYRKAVAIKEFTAPTSGELRVVVNHTKNPLSAGYRIELDGIAAKR